MYNVCDIIDKIISKLYAINAESLSSDKLMILSQQLKSIDEILSNINLEDDIENWVNDSSSFI